MLAFSKRHLQMYLAYERLLKFRIHPFSRRFYPTENGLLDFNNRTRTGVFPSWHLPLTKWLYFLSFGRLPNPGRFPAPRHPQIPKQYSSARLFWEVPALQLRFQRNRENGNHGWGREVNEQYFFRSIVVSSTGWVWAPLIIIASQGRLLTARPDFQATLVTKEGQN